VERRPNDRTYPVPVMGRSEEAPATLAGVGCRAREGVDMPADPHLRDGPGTVGAHGFPGSSMTLPVPVEGAGHPGDCAGPGPE